MRWARWLAAYMSVGQASALVASDPRFDVQVETVLAHDDGKFLWYHPRAAAVPGANGRPSVVVLTLQKHLIADDHYSGLHYMKSDDVGKTWVGPLLPKELDWTTDETTATVAVCDVTPGWHGPSRRVLAIGAKVRYTRDGRQLEDRPRSHQVAYASHDPTADRWTPWQWLELPDEPRYDLAVAGCTQWLVEQDGTVLLAIYYKPCEGRAYSTAVVRCKFDGQTLSVLETGNELALDDVRGLCEPSLAIAAGRYFLTLRNDVRGYLATSDDGLHFGPIQKWTFDDGSDLGSYNTQQHWLVHDNRLYLAYTRRGANNDHVIRNRAPLFLAEVDPAKLHVVRSTERVLIPERGGELGNFGAAAITPDESWVTVGEGVWSDDARRRGARGAVFVARIRWK